MFHLRIPESTIIDFLFILHTIQDKYEWGRVWMNVPLLLSILQKGSFTVSRIPMDIGDKSDAFVQTEVRV